MPQGQGEKMFLKKCNEITSLMTIEKSRKSDE